MRFSEKLKALRNEHKVTQKELAEAIGKTNRYISYYENEEGSGGAPPLDVVRSIADFFKIDISELLPIYQSEPTPELTLINKIIQRTIEGSIEWIDYKGSLENVSEEDFLRLKSVVSYLEKDNITTAFFAPLKTFLFVGREWMSDETGEYPQLFLFAGYTERHPEISEAYNVIGTVIDYGLEEYNEKLEYLLEILDGEDILSRKMLVSRIINDL